MLGHSIHGFAKIQQTFFAKRNDQFFSVSCFKRPGRSGASSGETIYALSNGLCSSWINIFSRNFLLPYALFSVIRRRDSANPIKHNLHMIAIGFPHTNLTSIYACRFASQNLSILHIDFDTDSLFIALIANREIISS